MNTNEELKIENYNSKWPTSFLEIKNLEQFLLEPKTRKNKELLGSLIADEFIEFSSSGKVYNKNVIIDALLNEENVQYSLTNFEVKELAPDVLLATYIAH